MRGGVEGHNQNMDDPIKQTLVGLRLSQLHLLARLTYDTGMNRSEIVRDAIDDYLKKKRVTGGPPDERTGSN